MGRNDSFKELESKILDNSGEKNAIPEMRFKQDIFILVNEMILANKRLDENFYRRNRNYRLIDKIEFMTCITAVFKLLKNMIREKELDKNSDHVKIFNRLIKLEYHEIDPEVSELIKMENFLLAYAHKLNLTNLLLKGGRGFEEMFGAEYG